MMPGCLSYIFEIIMFASGPHTFLGRGRTHKVPFLSAEENVLKLVHPCISEQQSWVIGRYQRRTFDNAVPLLLEISQELLSDLVSSQFLIPR
jgi:hypothetical protein